MRKSFKEDITKALFALKNIIQEEEMSLGAHLLTLQEELERMKKIKKIIERIEKAL